ncbi:hypothetical protein RHMOL_Rhmol08G0248900 [Rhododendron molle]|uniref:Uncharacterized protein n=1 Tax=Rhododendron molle TaxID=49168 RepID=A0ACC0MS00_RHOML|nr:hypothetical protein RHMOL_Rhmol08G0248900 [Rhododendron molle]
MYSSVKPVYKSSLSSAPNGCLFSLPAIFTTTKTSSYQDLSKPIKIHLSLSHSKPPFPFFSTNSSRTHSSTTVSASEDEELGVRLFVGNLEYGVDSEKLAQLFQQAGVVEVAEEGLMMWVILIMVNLDDLWGLGEVLRWITLIGETGESRGFGFINMSTVEEADKAIEMFHHFDLNGRLLIVHKATPRGSSLGQPGLTHKVFVANLPFDVDDERLEQLFSEHGKATKMQQQSNIDIGRFGTISFSASDGSALMKQILWTHSPHGLEGARDQADAVVKEKTGVAGFDGMLKEDASSINKILCEDAKVVISLAAFAANYGEFWLMAQLSTTNPLAKSVSLLKQLLNIRGHASSLKSRVDPINNLLHNGIDLESD